MPTQVNPNNGALFLSVLPEQEDYSDYVDHFLSDHDPCLAPCPQILSVAEEVREAFSRDEPVYLVRVLKKRYRYYDVDDTDSEVIGRYPTEHSCLTVVAEQDGYSYYIRLADHVYVGYYRANDGTREYTLNLFNQHSGGNTPRVIITGKQARTILKNARFGRVLTKNHETRYENLVDVALDGNNHTNLAYIPMGAIVDETLSSDYDYVYSTLICEAMNYVALFIMTEHRFMVSSRDYADMLIELPEDNVPNLPERYDRMTTYLGNLIRTGLKRGSWNQEDVLEMYNAAKHAANIGTGYSPNYVFVVATAALSEWVAKTRAQVDLTPCGTMFVMTPETETLAIATFEESLVYR